MGSIRRQTTAKQVLWQVRGLFGREKALELKTFSNDVTKQAEALCGVERKRKSEFLNRRFCRFNTRREVVINETI